MKMTSPREFITILGRRMAFSRATAAAKGLDSIRISTHWTAPPQGEAYQVEVRRGPAEPPVAQGADDAEAEGADAAGQGGEAARVKQIAVQAAESARHTGR